MKQCKVCGKMSNDAERFCFICGNRFEEKQDSGQTSDNSGRTIEIPDNIYSISDRAFWGFSNLRSVIIPQSVVSIGSSAFRECSNLENVEIPNSVKSIEDHAFRECTKLRSVVLPENIESIGEYVFEGCSSLTDFHFPFNITSIPEGLFLRCTALKHVTSSQPIKGVGASAFYGCSGLTDAIMPTMPTEQNCIPNSTFSGCSSLKNVDIPDYIVSIGDGAFANSGLTSVMIPENVVSIGDDAFANCMSLNTVMFAKGSRCYNRYHSAFSNCPNLKEIIVFDKEGRDFNYTLFKGAAEIDRRVKDGVCIFCGGKYNIITKKCKDCYTKQPRGLDFLNNI